MVRKQAEQPELAYMPIDMWQESHKSVVDTLERMDTKLDTSIVCLAEVRTTVRVHDKLLWLVAGGVVLGLLSWVGATLLQASARGIEIEKNSKWQSDVLDALNASKQRDKDVDVQHCQEQSKLPGAPYLDSNLRNQ